MPEETTDAYVLEQQVVEQIRGSRRRIDAELSKVIVGQADVIEQLMISLFAGGHCLVTGAPQADLPYTISRPGPLTIAHGEGRADGAGVHAAGWRRGTRARCRIWCRRLLAWPHRTKKAAW